MKLNAIGMLISRYEGRLKGKWTIGHTSIHIKDRVSFSEAHFVVLERSLVVSPYVNMHLIMLCSTNSTKLDDWIAREHRDNFGNWLHQHMMSKDTNDVLLELLANGPSTTIRTFQAYGINGYTFYTRAQDNKRTNQNSCVRIDAYDLAGNRETYYGFIEEI